MVRTLLLPFLGIFGGLLSAFMDITAKGLDRKSGEREREREREREKGKFARLCSTFAPFVLMSLFHFLRMLCLVCICC